MSSSQYAYRNPRLHSQRRSHVSNGSIELPSTWILSVYVVVFSVPVYILLRRYGLIPPNAIPHLLWNALVYLTPSRLVLTLEGASSAASADDMGTYAASRTFGAKSEALRLIVERHSPSILTRVPWARPFSISGALAASPAAARAAAGGLPGLGNLDNSCYQNSVLQGLAALPSVAAFLEHVLGDEGAAGDPQSTTWALRGTIEQLNDPANAGRRFWTPRVLKSMSSWQQQDAQEYYAKVVDALEKDAARASAKLGNASHGLADFRAMQSSLGEMPQMDGSSDASTDAPLTPPLSTSPSSGPSTPRNPFEGLLAQRVGCLSCGLVEGISLIPFNCLTLALGPRARYTLADRLDEYTKLEGIPEVECAHCTLRRQESRLARLVHQPSPTPSNGEDDDDAADPAADARRARFLAAARTRLAAVRAALAARDFSEPTLAQKCAIRPQDRVASTKTKQAVVARAPAALVLHMQRSVYDEWSGAQRKNAAAVRFPAALDLGPWCAARGGRWEMDPAASLLRMDADARARSAEERAVWYELKAVVAHYGRHEHGHYIAYRPDPAAADAGAGAERRWWRLSDANVTAVDEAFVLAQSGVFLLFYERRPTPTPAAEGSVGAADVASEEPHAVNLATPTDARDSGSAADTSEAALTPALPSTAPLRAPAASSRSDALPTPPASPVAKASTPPSPSSGDVIAPPASQDESPSGPPAAPPPPVRPLTPSSGSVDAGAVPTRPRQGAAVVVQTPERPAAACSPQVATDDREAASLVTAT